MPRLVIVSVALCGSILLLVGCSPAPTPEQKPEKHQSTAPTPAPTKVPAGMQQVTLYLPEMAKRLDIA